MGEGASKLTVLLGSQDWCCLVLDVFPKLIPGTGFPEFCWSKGLWSEHFVYLNACVSV